MAMRIAILSDIHANLAALENVLNEIDARQPDAVWCLGDIVGYGPHPQTCADIIRERAAVCLAGNHDLAVLGKIDLADFNPIAREAALWQRDRLNAESLQWLAGLPTRTEAEGITLAHGSPRHPVWEYVNNKDVAAENYDAFATSVCLVGHSHLAAGWRMRRQNRGIAVEWVTERPGVPITLELSEKWLLNPGSVGQPRDRDPRASFALLDTETWQWVWHRVAYDIGAAERDIIAAGLPEALGRRLYLGW
jgi:predicted phosphodiesterase